MQLSFFLFSWLRFMLQKLEPVVQFMPQPEPHPGAAKEQQEQLLRQVVLYMPQPEPEPYQQHLRRINSASF